MNSPSSDFFDPLCPPGIVGQSSETSPNGSQPKHSTILDRYAFKARTWVENLASQNLASGLFLADTAGYYRPPMSESVVNTTVATPVLPGWLQPSTVELRTCMLVVESGPDEGKAFGPIAEHATIGREPLCDSARISSTALPTLTSRFLLCAIDSRISGCSRNGLVIQVGKRIRKSGEKSPVGGISPEEARGRKWATSRH